MDQRHLSVSTNIRIYSICIVRIHGRWRLQNGRTCKLFVCWINTDSLGLNAMILSKMTRLRKPLDLRISWWVNEWLCVGFNVPQYQDDCGKKASKRNVKRASFLLAVGALSSIYTERGHSLSKCWRHSIGSWSRYNFTARSFSTMKLCSRLLMLFA